MTKIVFGVLEKEQIKDSNNAQSVKHLDKVNKTEQFVAFMTWIIFCVTWLTFSVKLGGLLLKPIIISICIISFLALARIGDARY